MTFINNINTLPFKYIVILWLIILSIIFLSNKKKYTLSKEELKQSRTSFKLFLDQYYISNKLITFLLCFFYTIGICFIFIILRYMYLGHTNYLKFSNSDDFMWPIILLYLKLFITLMLYRALLKSLFKKEINKLYLYISQFFWLTTFYKVISFKVGEYIIGCIRVPCYRIATLTYKEDLYIPGNLPYFIHDDEYHYFINNKKFIQLILKVQDFAKQYSLIKKIFVIFAHILRFIHIHISEVCKQLPYFILSIIFILEIYNKELKYIYIASFIFLLIKIKCDIVSYIFERSSMYDYTLSKYFYCNEIDYAVQRMSFYQNNHITIEKPIYTEQNKMLYRSQDKIVDYIYNQFELLANNTKHKRRKEGFYRRYLTIMSIIFILLNIIGYTNNMLVLVVLFVPIAIMIYTGYKTYYPETYEEDPWVAADWKYSRTHNIIFWIVAIIQGYLFWILLLKPELIISDTEVLLDSFIKITRIYTLEEKIMYLYNYFEYVLSQSALPIGEQETIRYLLRQIDYSEIIEINETTTLKEIMYKVKEFIRTEYYGRQRHVIVIEYLVKLVEREERLAMNPTFVPWYTLLKNVLFIAAVVPTILYSIQYYSKLWTIINKLQDPYELYRIAGEIMSMDPYGRSFFWYRYTVLEFLTKLKTKLPSVLDIMLVYGIDYIPLQTRLILSGVTTALSGTVLLPKIIAYFETKLSSENLESWNEKGTYVAAPEIGVESTILLNVSLYFCMALLIILIIMWIIYRRKRKTFN